MKNIISLFSLVAVLYSTNANATHAYRSEICQSANLNLGYLGNYPVGGDYGISKIGSETEIIALPTYDSETPNTLEDAEVIFSELSTKVTEVGPSSQDCWFDHEEWKSEKVIEINSLSVEAALILGLKAGDKLTFACEESSDIPNDLECEEDNKE